MPKFLPPEAARLELRDGAPVMTLAVEVPAQAAGDWSLVNGGALFVVDGPGDDGFLMPRLGPEGDIAPDGWDEAVERVAGSRVVFGTDPDAPAVFARVLGASG